METITDQQVCLLIDFENLVYGLKDQYGEDRLADELNVNLLFNLAEEYGHVVLANAYADWRAYAVNQFQIDLYRLGVDLVHVVAKRGKNAVDVKMAVDAIETIWTLPHIQTFIIVSGDRDFIHVLKMLRRHGKTVVGVAPAESTSDDFAALCDRFLRYAALASTYTSMTALVPPESTEGETYSVLRRALHKIMTEYGIEGLKGAQIKPLLRRELTPTFDESEYGFLKLSQLLRAFPDVIRVEKRNGGSDIIVYPANGKHARTGAEVDKAISGAPRDREELIRTSGLLQQGKRTIIGGVERGSRCSTLPAFGAL